MNTGPSECYRFRDQIPLCTRCDEREALVARAQELVGQHPQHCRRGASRGKRLGARRPISGRSFRCCLRNEESHGRSPSGLAPLLSRRERRRTLFGCAARSAARLGKGLIGRLAPKPAESAVMPERWPSRMSFSPVSFLDGSAERSRGRSQRTRLRALARGGSGGAERTKALWYLGSRR